MIFVWSWISALWNYFSSPIYLGLVRLIFDVLTKVQKRTILIWKWTVFVRNGQFSCQSVSLEFLPMMFLWKLPDMKRLFYSQEIKRCLDRLTPGIWIILAVTVNWRSKCAWAWPWWPWFTSWHWSDDRKYLLS